MKKYNLSEIMKRAWASYRLLKISKISFAECLKSSWRTALIEREEAESIAAEEARGIVTMHYADYKRNYSGCNTVEGSYNRSNKTIKVYTLGLVAAPVKATPVKMVAKNKTSHDGRCRHCGTWCYGDCMAS